WSSAPAREPFELPRAPPWSYLRDARAAPIDQRYAESFRASGRELRLDVLVSAPGDPAARVVACAFPLDEGIEPSTVPMRMLQVRADRATFAALYRSGSTEKEPLACDVAEDALDRLRVDLRIGERTILHRVPILR
ncbi:MAG: hypothetical protein JXA90_12965, partial [Planctomycetes bacterium]|nr:hypothetical protein [Planctomycetota bacterium]